MPVGKEHRLQNSICPALYKHMEHNRDENREIPAGGVNHGAGVKVVGDRLGRSDGSHAGLEGRAESAVRVF